MAIDFTFDCPLPNGVHARPASALEARARRFTSDVTLLKERTGQAANAKSVLAIVGLAIEADDRCRVTVSGADEQEAAASLRQFILRDLPQCDEPLVAVAAPPGARVLPRMLEESGVPVWPAIPVVAGIGQGRARLLGHVGLPPGIPRDDVADVTREVALVDEALAALGDRYDGQIRDVAGTPQAGVLAAHRAILRDPEFRRQLVTAVRERRRTGAGAIVEAEAYFSATLALTGSELLRERALDVQDVCRALLRHLYGEAATGSGEAVLSRPSVCFARTMSPGQFLALDRGWLKGLVLAEAGTTSHTVVLARAFGVPTLVDLDVPAGIQDGTEVVVDGDLGVLVPDPTDAARRYYAMERRRLDARHLRQRQAASLPAETGDGRRIEVAANIATAGEAEAAFRSGADEIGLFRTEMLFAGRDGPPGEDEQVEHYRVVAAAARGRPVIVRALDAGGDKPIPYLRLPAEANPFLGYRGVRLYREFDALFRCQVRAVLRASRFGPLCLMIPMISRVEEARWVAAVVAEERQRLADAGIACGDRVPVGAMVEVPSAALALDRLAGAADFFSIGTNDLLQYFGAVDRGNPKVAALYEPCAPAFLRLLQTVVTAAGRAGRWIGLCGEMGGEPDYLPLLVGLGLDEISMAAPRIAEVKARVRTLSFRACRELFEQAVACATAAEVRDLLVKSRVPSRLPLIDPDLVVFGAEARTKAEAIKQAVDVLYVTGRTEQPRAVEEAVWRREAVYSTGVGYGLAIPHCKTDAVGANALVVVKPHAPVAWTPDEDPVRLLLLLAIRESDQQSAHLRILAALGRRLMHEEFRGRLLDETDEAALCRLIEETVARRSEP